MRKWLAFHWKRRGLQRALDRHDAEYSKALSALDSPTHKKKEELFHEFRMEENLIEDELMHLVSSYWTFVANKHLIPVPEFKTEGGAWEEARTTGRYHLSRQALSDLRAAICKEKKERHELWLLWLAGLTGVIGALTGLAAIAL